MAIRIGGPGIAGNGSGGGSSSGGIVELSGTLQGSSGGAASTYCANAGDFTSSTPFKYQVSARTFTKMRVTTRSAATLAVVVAVTLFKNGVATAMTLNVAIAAASGAKYSDLAHSITFADGDTYDVQLSAATDSSNGAAQVSVTLE